MTEPIEKYGALWPAGTSAIAIEKACVKRGGKWIDSARGVECGVGLFHHYKAAQQLLWPDDDHHRWSDLCLESILAHTHIAILGPKDSGKTYVALARYGLTDYFFFPDNTLILISSTDIRGLELRVWGALKDLWRRARERVPWFPGRPLESKHAICTDNLDEDADLVRDMRKGIICIPCRSTTGAWLGINNYVGIKQERKRLLSDEVQFMAEQFMDAPASLMKASSNRSSYKGVYVGHPLGQSDPLDKIAEPKNGWGTEGEITRTTTWANKWNDGVTINLVGTDSPNFDDPPGSPVRFPYLVNQKDIDDTVAFYGRDSVQYWSKCIGIRRPGLSSRRVISLQLCEQFGAFDLITWAGPALTKLYAIDAAYGRVGGDRCVGMPIEFGLTRSGKIMLHCHQPDIIPVSVRFDRSPEDQIAIYVRARCEKLDIPPNHVYFDSTGRGSLGSAFARQWSAFVCPVEFGGKATDRPVTLDHWIVDPQTKQRRLKKCSEEYSKFVTELWFSVRYAIEAGQVRELPRDVAQEGCQREWKQVAGGRIEIETKDEMKERTGRSPDLFDCLATGIEGARRLGFGITKLANAETNPEDLEWLEDLRRQQRAILERQQLNYTA